MWLNNKGQTETEILQNRFTAYLSRAIRRRRNEYIQRILKRQQTESLTECLMSDIGYSVAAEPPVRCGVSHQSEQE